MLTGGLMTTVDSLPIVFVIACERKPQARATQRMNRTLGGYASGAPRALHATCRRTPRPAQEPQAIRERVGKRGVSAYLEKAARRQIERDNLDELIADFDKANGPADPEAVAAKRARLTGSPASGTGAAV
jgi:hypothetical protein